MKVLLGLLVIGLVVWCDGQRLGMISAGQTSRGGQNNQNCGFCTYDYRPVCGRDLRGGHQTFPNQCAMDSENRCRGGSYQKVHDGVCNTQEMSYRAAASGRPRAQTGL